MLSDDDVEAARREVDETVEAAENPLTNHRSLRSESPLRGSLCVARRRWLYASTSVHRNPTGELARDAPNWHATSPNPGYHVTARIRKQQSRPKWMDTNRMRGASATRLAEEMCRDESVFVMGEDVGSSRGVQGIEARSTSSARSGVREHADLEKHDRRGRVGGDGRLRSVVELMTVNFSLGLDQIVKPIIRGGDPRRSQRERAGADGGIRRCSAGRPPAWPHPINSAEAPHPGAGTLVARLSTPGRRQVLLGVDPG